jgi:phosphatidylglycerophosphate synthase
MTSTTETRTVRDALVRLRASQKTSKGAPAYGRYVNRPLGRYLAALAYVAHRTPNQVTAASAVCTFAGIVVMATVRPGVATSILVVALLVLGYALDAADGQLARLRGGGSAAGEFLDHIVDSVKIATLHLAVFVCWWRFYDVKAAYLAIPLIFGAVATVQFFGMILTDQLRRAHRGSAEMRLQGEGSSSPLYSLAVVPTDYGLLCVSFVLMFWHSGFMVVYGLLALANLAFVFLALPKWYREISRFG